MGMIAVLPDFPGVVFADGEREAAFDELHRTFDGVIEGRCKKDVDVVGHDDEAVELEAALFAVAEECCEHQVSV